VLSHTPRGVEYLLAHFERRRIRQNLDLLSAFHAEKPGEVYAAWKAQLVPPAPPDLARVAEIFGTPEMARKLRLHKLAEETMMMLDRGKGARA
jgi:hypothetical protein